jgi:DNA (cytosine-5)-methyltransferase 1
MSLRLEKVLAAAEWYDCQESDPFVSSRAMAANPLVPLTVARLAALVGCPDEAPVLASSGALRLVARFTGTRIDNFNRNSDGRLAIARMIGGSVFDDDTETERHAQLRLLDLAAGTCVPSHPDCSSCDLESWCSYANELGS